MKYYIMLLALALALLGCEGILGDDYVQPHKGWWVCNKPAEVMCVINVEPAYRADEYSLYCWSLRVYGDTLVVDADDVLVIMPQDTSTLIYMPGSGCADYMLED